MKHLHPRILPMRERKLILIGAGGHSCSVMDSAISSGHVVVGFIDEIATGQHLGIPILGKGLGDIHRCHDYAYHIAIGNCQVRRRWYNILADLGLEVVNIIDPSAIISSYSHIGTGNFVGKMAIISAGTSIGDNNIINTNALIEHGCRIGNHANISTKSTLNGDVIVDDEVFFGSNAVCNGQKRLGFQCVVGSGSVVTRDVEPFSTVAGVPARVISVKNEVIW
jgi:sugar O-acyltransferase (sialic acid O-acetyltransferase NeuD family)